MNSFNTDEDTIKVTNKYHHIRVNIHTFNQSRFVPSKTFHLNAKTKGRTSPKF